MRAGVRGLLVFCSRGEGGLEQHCSFYLATAALLIEDILDFLSAVA